jgi:pimeloyl-ACP methyl ester carboxylesterase
MALAPAAIAGFSSATESVGGVQLHYRLGGDRNGPPVLLWHGFCGTGYIYRNVATALAESGCAVLVPDMRGYGDSDKPAGTDGYDGRSLAEEFRALVRQLGFGNGRPLTLVAHDMGAPPALLWAADHPGEIAGLIYMEEPVLLAGVLSKIIVYTPDVAKLGSMWWWLLPLAPDVPERLIVGNERAFLTWFYDRAIAAGSSIDPLSIEEYLRTFSGHDGVLGALGVYRGAFATIEQTEPLLQNKVRVPVIALGGDRSRGNQVREMIERVASDVSGGIVANCGHFVPEERPEQIVGYVMELLGRAVR